MHRFWFKVYHQGQPVAPPLPVPSLPRGTRITGTIAIVRRSRALTAVYVLAADGEQAQ